MIKFLIIFLFIISTLEAREVGQTEITTEEGIEVYQKDKFYLLKKNVEIDSDNFKLKAQNVKAYFEKDLYDITDIYSTGDVILTSNEGLKAIGEKIDFNVKSEDIYIEGKGSFLKTKDFEMQSDGSIKVNNSTGNFSVIGKNAKIITTDTIINGEKINGNYININDVNEVQKLKVVDEKQINIKTETLDMYALKADYDKQKDIIELFENVKIFRGTELITGDYAKINTIDESYKISSKKTKKVKVLLNQSASNE